MAKKLEEGLTQQLEAGGVPRPKAQAKARNTIRGIYFMIIGTVALLVGLGIVIVPMLILGQAPSVWLIAFGALAIVMGFQLGLMGANAYSGEIVDGEDQSNAFILTVGKAIGLARGKIKNGD
jgi:hypothetical protein